jgi:hypothetical protein
MAEQQTHEYNTDRPLLAEHMKNGGDSHRPRFGLPVLQTQLQDFYFDNPTM